VTPTKRRNCGWSGSRQWPVAKNWTFQTGRKEGFVSVNYNITIYALIYKHIHNYKGKLTVEQDLACF